MRSWDSSLLADGGRGHGTSRGPNPGAWLARGRPLEGLRTYHIVGQALAQLATTAAFRRSFHHLRLERFLDWASARMRTVGRRAAICGSCDDSRCCRYLQRTLSHKYPTECTCSGVPSILRGGEVVIPRRLGLLRAFGSRLFLGVSVRSGVRGDSPVPTHVLGAGCEALHDRGRARPFNNCVRCPHAPVPGTTPREPGPP